MLNNTKVTRRSMMMSLLRGFMVGTGVNALVPLRALAESHSPGVTVYKDPGCECCTKWVAYLRDNGFAPVVKDRSDMSALKDSLGVPSELRSCHTAVLGKFVIEGHVPVAEMKRLLAAPPRGMIGLAVPGMPSGSPGMEMPGRADAYSVIAFAANGTTVVFGRHG